MNVIKYCCPFKEVVGNEPQMSVCISSKTFEHLLVPNFFMFFLNTFPTNFKFAKIKGIKNSI